MQNEITAIQKLEFVQNMYNQMGLDFSKITVEQAFGIYREVQTILEMNLSHPGIC